MSQIARFYQDVGVAQEAGGFGLRLDGRALKTPAGRECLAPTRALAEACAEEWGAQGKFVTPATMPLTQLVFAAIDKTPARRDEFAAFVAKFGETDLCCHRAETPNELVALQVRRWDPLVRWAALGLGIELPVVTGVRPGPVNPYALERLHARAAALDDFRLTALAQAAGASGSALIGFALVTRHINGETAFAAAALDELWSQERWGEDAEAQARLGSLRSEFAVLETFLTALEGA